MRTCVAGSTRSWWVPLPLVVSGAPEARSRTTAEIHGSVPGFLDNRAVQAEASKGAEIQLGRVRVTEHAIEEVVHRTTLVSVPRAGVRRVVLRRGVVAERPLFMVVVGAALTALGVYGVIEIVRGIEQGGMIFGSASAALLIALVGGPLLIATALRRGLVLEVSTERETRKLGFRCEADAAALDGFVTAAARGGVIVERP
jgi:hypothetical protein